MKMNMPIVLEVVKKLDGRTMRSVFPSRSSGVIFGPIDIPTIDDSLKPLPVNTTVTGPEPSITLFGTNDRRTGAGDWANAEGGDISAQEIKIDSIIQFGTLSVFLGFNRSIALIKFYVRRIARLGEKSDDAGSWWVAR